ncbi:Clavaminate synthase-like protein [Poronia punctata]|nr:Clavaminate synthase-like protein [Poronia punctata]
MSVASIPVPVRLMGIDLRQASPVSPSERAKAAAVVLNRYRIEYKNDWDIPPSIHHAETQIRRALERTVPIELVIPAFPFKSSNRSKKVLGPLPDEAERLSLLHLNGLCRAMRDAAGAETFLTIVSDGITYNDILGVSDEEVWRYGQQLRRMAKLNGCDNIRFARICDLVDTKSEELTETLYLDRVSEYRRLLIAKTPPDFDVLEAIVNDPDISKTYKGYKKFLMGEREDRPNRSRSQTERENGSIAKAMILRGKAFAEAVRAKYTDSIRLSIHPSIDTNKVSIAMLPQDNDIVMTPWHGAVVRGADGRVAMTHAILVPAITHDIVYDEGRPSYFRERSDVLNWAGMDVTFEYLYPCGVVVRPAKETFVYPLASVDMDKVRTLALTCSPVVLRGFSDTQADRTPVAEASGNVTPIISRTSGTSLLLLHNEDIGPGSGQVYQSLRDTPIFQYFKVPSQRHQLGTLFASSDLFARYLPEAYNIKKLSKIKWTRRGPESVVSGIPLVVSHPTRHSMYICWRRPDEQVKVSIDNGSQNLVGLIDALLLDPRVCLRFSWEEGDVLVTDKFSTLLLSGDSPIGTHHAEEPWKMVV